MFQTDKNFCLHRIVKNVHITEHHSRVLRFVAANSTLSTSSTFSGERLIAIIGSWAGHQLQNI